MSTPASLHIRNGGQSSSFSQRCDGYPTHVMAALAHWVVTGGANKDDGIDHNGRALNNAHLCQYSRETRESQFTSLTLTPYPMLTSQNPADRDCVQYEIRSGDWSYLIDLDAKTIKVFENPWTGHSSSFDNEPTDPRSYVTVLYPEYQARELLIIDKAIQALTEAGFTIN